MQTRLRRPVPIVLAVAGALVLGGACGDGSKSPREILAAASSETLDAKSSRVSFTAEMAGVAGVEGPLRFGGEGAVDFDGRRATLSIELPAVGGMQFGRMEAVLIDTVMYQRFPEQIARELGGKPWIKIDLDDVGKLIGVDLGALTQSQSADPTQALTFLEGASDDVTVVGKEQVRDVPTTHYKASLDLAKAAEHARSDRERKALRQAAELYQGGPIPAEVWIDEEGRLRRLAYTMDMSKLKLPAEIAANVPKGSMSFNMELFDFGVEVNAEPPPADQTIDFAELQRRSGGG